MKNNKNLDWSSREGQITPLMAVAVTTLFVIVMGIGGWTLYKTDLKAKKIETATVKCAGFDVEQCEKDELAKNQAAAEEARIRKLAEETQTELATERAVNAPNDNPAPCDKNGDPNVYLNCLNNEARLEKETPEQAKLREEVSAIAAGSESSQWAAVDWIKSIWNRVITFFVSPSERTMIELDSLPTAKTCVPSTSCINFCKYGGDLQNCRTTNADCSVSLFTKGTSCLPAPSTSGGGGGGTSGTTNPSGGSSTPTPAKTCVPYDPYAPENIDANLVKVRLECGSWNPYENKGTVISTRSLFDACVSNYWDSATVECP